MTGAKNPQLTTHYPQLTTRNSQLATRNSQPATRNMKDLSLHIMDIVQNSIEAGADMITMIIQEDIRENMYTITVEDNGKGMTQDVLERVVDPYFTSRKTRKVGMGIPLFMQTARQSGGELIIDSTPGKGTKVVASFQHDHIDRPVPGDIAGVVSLLAGSNPGKDFIYKHNLNGNEYIFDTREVKEALEGMPISELSVIKYLKEMIHENLTNL
jgi:anti-sigma regulatory factor (Ser/Thr protein kinase)